MKIWKKSFASRLLHMLPKMCAQKKNALLFGGNPLLISLSPGGCRYFLRLILFENFCFSLLYAATRGWALKIHIIACEKVPQNRHAIKTRTRVAKNSSNAKRKGKRNSTISEETLIILNFHLKFYTYVSVLQLVRGEMYNIYVEENF